MLMSRQHPAPILAWGAPAAILLFVISMAGAGCRTPASREFLGKLPPPPAGFRWEHFPEAGVAVPCPPGWHRASSLVPGVFNASLSLEKASADGAFATGFTVKLIAGIRERSGRTPAHLGAAMFSRLVADSGTEVLVQEPFRVSGGGRAAFVRFRGMNKLGRKITAHRFYLAMDRADLLYIYTFESPSETWDEAFARYGVPMLENIAMMSVPAAKLQ